MTNFNTLDLYAQRYATTLQPLTAPGAPYILPLDSYTLSASWPPLLGFDVSYYGVVRGRPPKQTSPTTTCGQIRIRTTIPAASTTSNSPMRWRMAEYRRFPRSRLAPPGARIEISTDCRTIGKRCIMVRIRPIGHQPINYSLRVSPLWRFSFGAPIRRIRNTWLKQWITQTPEGLFLNWNTVPGGIYQVLSTTDFKTWTDYGAPRFEAGSTDSVYLGQSNKSYFRIVRNRY